MIMQTLQVLSDTGMQITVNTGKAWINGYFYQNTTTLSLTLANASGTLNRIDSIVVQCDFTEREMRTAIKQGTPSNSPVAPSLVRTPDMYEIQLATVYIKAGTASISQEDITDTRMNNSVCGVVAGVVDQIDTEGLFAQYDDEWNYWFDNVKGTLSGDVAGNLQNQITELQSSKAVTAIYTANIPVSWTGEQAPYSAIFTT